MCNRSSWLLCVIKFWGYLASTMCCRDVFQFRLIELHELRHRLLRFFPRFTFMHASLSWIFHQRRRSSCKQCRHNFVSVCLWLLFQLWCYCLHDSTEWQLRYRLSQQRSSLRHTLHFGKIYLKPWNGIMFASFRRLFRVDCRGGRDKHRCCNANRLSGRTVFCCRIIKLYGLRHW